MITRRRRGTAIVETKEGILVVSRNNRTFFLPGGGAENDESRRDAAIRELKEETGLQAVTCRFLFEYPTFVNDHKVFLIKATGNAEPENEIKYIDYFDGSNLKLSYTTWEIIELYHLRKKIEAEKNKAALNALPQTQQTKPKIVSPKK